MMGRTVIGLETSAPKEKIFLAREEKGEITQRAWVVLAVECFAIHVEC